MTEPRPTTAIPRPDPVAVLLEAIQQRDAALSHRLVMQWVHRRGLASLQQFQSTTLVRVAGSEAGRWLEELLQQPAALTVTLEPGEVPPASAPTSAPLIRVHDLIDPDAVLAAEPAQADREPLQRVEAAFAALAAEFASSAPVAPEQRQAPEPPVASAAAAFAPEPPAPTESTLVAVEPSPPVAAALPLSFAIASATELAAASADRSAVAGVPPAVPTVIEPGAGSADAAPSFDGGTAVDSGELPERRFSLSGRLPRLGRLKRLMRDCYEGAIGSLQPVRAGDEPDEPDDEPIEATHDQGSGPAAEASAASDSLPLPPFLDSFEWPPLSDPFASLEPLASLEPPEEVDPAATGDRAQAHEPAAESAFAAGPLPTAELIPAAELVPAVEMALAAELQPAVEPVPAADEVPAVEMASAEELVPAWQTEAWSFEGSIPIASEPNSPSSAPATPPLPAGEAAAAAAAAAPPAEALSQAVVEEAVLAAPVEPVAPLPAFHSPGIGTVEHGTVAAEQAPIAGQQAQAAVRQAAADLSRASASMASRLRRFGTDGASQRPAPAPDALADLRAWLPDDGNDLPRAC